MTMTQAVSLFVGVVIGNVLGIVLMRIIEKWLDR